MQSARSAIFLAEYRAECKIITYPRASIVAQSLTVIRNFARIPESQESARINAFHYVCFPPSAPRPGVGSIKPRLCLRRSVRSAIAKLIKFRESLAIRLKELKKIVPHRPPIFFVWGEPVSVCCEPVSCNDRRIYGRLHLPCDPMGASCRCLHRRMTWQTGLRRRDSQGIDTWDAFQSLDNNSVPVMTSILENANSFLPRSLSEWPM